MLGPRNEGFQHLGQFLRLVSSLLFQNRQHLLASLIVASAVRMSFR